MTKDAVLDKIEYMVGSSDVIMRMPSAPSLFPFHEKICSFLIDLSDDLMKNPEVRSFSDISTFAFWIRKASIQKMKEGFIEDVRGIFLGKGLVFHIAPSNVAMNFAYSLTAGLLTGNANVVRLPSKYFRQTEIMCQEINKILEKHDEVKQYICLVKYGHEKEINDYLSSVCDERIIWGGDNTISEIRKSPLPSRSQEITFADRYSLTVIDSDHYIKSEDRHRIASDFYNDTYLSDQNACTSPKIVIWKGKNSETAKAQFWAELYEVVKEKYDFRPIQAVDKLDAFYRVAVDIKGVKIQEGFDNRLVRVKVDSLSDMLISHSCHSGFFYEYDCKDILELKDLCDDKRCQTVSYIGQSDMFMPLINSGIKGIDRIVEVGKTMDFDLVWDGYDLRRLLTRIIGIR